MREQFAANSDTAVTVVVPDSAGVSPEQVSGYAADLSRVADVAAVSAPTGTYVAGSRTAHRPRRPPHATGACT